MKIKLSGKPILWIHTNYDVNARNWLDFKSEYKKFKPDVFGDVWKV